ncbi:large ribosomal subunit protein mL52 isoform X1 [Anolis sagrei]|uniref:large ribosomal subunit protein mL52 isoform X1 n=1 Tax=Anolis sagrei TaxID=38937 RepID=UPI00352130CD
MAAPFVAFLLKWRRPALLKWRPPVVFLPYGSFETHGTELVSCRQDGSVHDPEDRQGFPVNPSEFGPLTDLPDWSFADGRPAPPMKGYLRRREKNAELARRVVEISAEIDRGMEKWEAKQREAEQAAQEKRRNRLQPKAYFVPETAK